MSVCFYLENVFDYDCLTIQDSLRVIEGTKLYNFNEYATEDKVILQQKLCQYECVRLGKEHYTARGFELSYSSLAKCYEIRIPTPASINDWKFALEYLVTLAKDLDLNQVRTRAGKYYDLETILNFDYTVDIKYGLDLLYENLCDYSVLSFAIVCLNRTVYFNKHIIEKIKGAKNPVQVFSNYILAVDNIKAFFAQQAFYETAEGIYGVYSLTENCRTVLPKNPNIELKYQDIIKKVEVAAWKASLIVVNGDPSNQEAYQVLGIISISDLFAKIPPQKVKHLDAYNYIIEGLSKEEIRQLV